jgi:hypothetical protein
MVVASVKEIRSIVTLRTVDGSGGEIQGVTVKYRFSGTKEDALTAKEPSRCLQTMPIGNYNIWAERGGKAVSSQDAKYTIRDKMESVVILVEKK